MDKNHLLQITNELYRLTLLFPKKEPLRYEMRELANKVLANFVSLSQGTPRPERHILVKNSWGVLEVLDSFFEVAKTQNWVSPKDILKTREGYNKLYKELKEEFEVKLHREEFKEKLYLPNEEFEGEIYDELKKELKEKGEETEIDKIILVGPAQIPSLSKEEKMRVSDRQQEIIEILREKGGAQVWEIKEILSQVSKRTLRRDFENLLKKGIVERIGEKNATFYQLKSRTG